MPRAAKSALMHLHEGNPNRLVKKEINRRAKNEEKLRVSDDKLEPPTWLESSAKKHFRMIVDVMKPTKVLTNADVDLIALYCDTYYDYCSYKRKVRQTGMVNNDTGKPNPFIKEKRTAATALVKYANELGLTPSARASLAINLDDKSDGDDDEF